MKSFSPQNRSIDSEPFIALLLDIRRELKAAQEFALADQIRERLNQLGVKLEDRAGGTSWTFDETGS
jgi:cysteinyl-tRNA synthetase